MRRPLNVSLGRLIDSQRARTRNFDTNRICEQRRLRGDSAPEPSLFAYTKYGSRWILGQKFRPLASIDTTAWVFKWGSCAYAITINISGALSYRLGDIAWDEWECFIIYLLSTRDWLNWAVTTIYHTLSYETWRTKASVCDCCCCTLYYPPVTLRRTHWSHGPGRVVSQHAPQALCLVRNQIKQGLLFILMSLFIRMK